MLFDLAGARLVGRGVGRAAHRPALAAARPTRGLQVTGRVTPKLRRRPGLRRGDAGRRRRRRPIGQRGGSGRGLRRGRWRFRWARQGVVFADHATSRCTSRAGIVHAFCHAVPGRWHMMSVMLSAAGSLRWFRDALAPGVHLRELVDDGGRRSPPGGTDCSSCPTSLASARPIPIRWHAAHSSA